jgi:hypothetical protein
MIEIEIGSANIYEDLGLPEATEMQVKAILAADVEIIVRKPSCSRTIGCTSVVFA